MKGEIIALRRAKKKKKKERKFFEGGYNEERTNVR